jgi:hypothetical protein
MSASRIFALLVMALLLASLLVAGNAKAETITNTETRTIDYNDYTVIMNYRAVSNSFVAFTFEVEIGTNVDVLIMDQVNYEAYQTDSSFSYLVGSALNSQNGAGSGSTPEEGTNYYVVIDNTDRPSGGANPTGPVQVHYTVTATDIDIPALITNVMIIAVVGIVGFVVVIFVVLYLIFFRKPKSQAPSTASSQMKFCPQCGSSVPGGFQYCPKCGYRW